MDTPIETQTPTEVTAPSPEPAPATPEAVRLTDDALVEYTVNGNPVRKPWAQVRDELPVNVFFEKTRALADERRAFETEQQQVREYVQQVQQWHAMQQAALKDKNKLGALYLAALGEEGQPGTPAQQAAFDPQQLSQMVSSTVQQQLAAWQQQQAQAAQQSSINTELAEFGKALFKGTPLERVPNADEMVWAEVFAAQPASLAQAKQLAQMKAQEVIQALNIQAQNAAAVAQVQAAKVAGGGIEPSSGRPVAPQARTYTGLDDPRRNEDFVAAFKQSLGV